MQPNYKYSLDKSSKKHLCPQCNKRRFTLYIDTETNEPLPAIYGKCDRSDNCTYHLNPYKDGYAKDQLAGDKQAIDWKPKPKAKPIYFDLETFKQTLNPERYEINTFIENLLKTVKFPFDIESITKVIELYYLGTVAKGYLTGANTFPFIDINGNVRAVQVKQFDKANHTTQTNFLHSIIEKHHTRNKTALPAWLQAYNKNESKVSCLFGEHLLSKYPNNPIALVEAPKTAIYGTLYLGQPEHPKNFIWLAVYNKSSFSIDKLKVLKGRDVFVFPDLSKDGSTYKEWETKAKEYQKLLTGTRFVFSDLLERLATKEQKEQGADIADVLINLDWKAFRKDFLGICSRVEKKPPPTPEPWEMITPPTEQPKKEHPEDWSETIKELESYFLNAQNLNSPIELNKGAKIISVPQFIESHLRIVKYNNGKKIFIPYLNRLQELKSILIKQAIIVNNNKIQ
jgi:hypothetical protein